MLHILNFHLIHTFYLLPFAGYFLLAYFRTPALRSRPANLFLCMTFAACFWRFWFFHDRLPSNRYVFCASFLLLILSCCGMFLAWERLQIRYVWMKSRRFIFAFFLLSVTVSALKMFHVRDSLTPQQELLELVRKDLQDNRSVAVILVNYAEPRLTSPDRRIVLTTMHSREKKRNELNEKQVALNFSRYYLLVRSSAKHSAKIDEARFTLCGKRSSRRTCYRLYKNRKPARQEIPDSGWTVIPLDKHGALQFSASEAQKLTAIGMSEADFAEFVVPEQWTINKAHQWGPHCLPVVSRFENGVWRISGREPINIYRRTSLPAIPAGKLLAVKIRAGSRAGGRLGLIVYPVTRNYTVFPELVITEKKDYLFLVPGDVTHAQNPRLALVVTGSVDVEAISYAECENSKE